VRSAAFRSCSLKGVTRHWVSSALISRLWYKSPALPYRAIRHRYPDIGPANDADGIMLSRQPLKWHAVRARRRLRSHDRSRSNLQRAAAGRHATAADGRLHQAFRCLPPRRDHQTGPAHLHALLDFAAQLDVLTRRHRGQQRGQHGGGAARRGSSRIPPSGPNIRARSRVASPSRRT
jgi:hypothetical protein